MKFWDTIKEAARGDVLIRLDKMPGPRINVSKRAFFGAIYMAAMCGYMLGLCVMWCLKWFGIVP